MSQLVALPSLELLLIAGRAVALLLGLLIFAWAFRHWRRAAMRDTQRVFEQLDLVRSELLIMKEVMHHSARRTDAPLPARESRAAMSNGGARGYEIAARMARSGASHEELIQSCGINAHEAELLVKLHGHRRDMPQANTANTSELVDLVGRQPRLSTAQSNSQSNSQPNAKHVAKAAMPRPAVAAPVETQRKPAPQTRSRLVAVG